MGREAAPGRLLNALPWLALALCVGILLHLSYAHHWELRPAGATPEAQRSAHVALLDSRHTDGCRWKSPHQNAAKPSRYTLNPQGTRHSQFSAYPACSAV